MALAPNECCAPAGAGRAAAAWRTSGRTRRAAAVAGGPPAVAPEPGGAMDTLWGLAAAVGRRGQRRTAFVAVFSFRRSYRREIMARRGVWQLQRQAATAAVTTAPHARAQADAALLRVLGEQPWGSVSPGRRRLRLRPPAHAARAAQRVRGD